jgi:hypothetical protein
MKVSKFIALSSLALIITSCNSTTLKLPKKHMQNFQLLKVVNGKEEFMKEERPLKMYLNLKYLHLIRIIHGLFVMKVQVGKATKLDIVCI